MSEKNLLIIGMIKKALIEFGFDETEIEKGFLNSTNPVKNVSVNEKSEKSCGKERINVVNRRKSYYGTKLICNNEFCNSIFFVSDEKRSKYNDNKWPLPKICKKCQEIRYNTKNKSIN